MEGVKAKKKKLAIGQKGRFEGLSKGYEAIL